MLRIILVLVVGVLTGYCYSLLFDDPAAMPAFVVIIILHGLSFDSSTTIWHCLVRQAFFPIYFAVSMIHSLFGLGLMLATIPFDEFRSWSNRRRFRSEMEQSGRLIAFWELIPKLWQEKGTLIEEWGPKGAVRIWWTGDDILALGRPVTTDKELMHILHGLPHLFNAYLMRQYLDPTTGQAFLTTLPSEHGISWLWRFLFYPVRSATVVPSYVDNIQLRN